MSKRVNEETLVNLMNFSNFEKTYISQLSSRWQTQTSYAVLHFLCPPEVT